MNTLTTLSNQYIFFNLFQVSRSMFNSTSGFSHRPDSMRSPSLLIGTAIRRRWYGRSGFIHIWIGAVHRWTVGHHREGRITSLRNMMDLLSTWWLRLISIWTIRRETSVITEGDRRSIKIFILCTGSITTCSVTGRHRYRSIVKRNMGVHSRNGRDWMILRHDLIDGRPTIVTLTTEPPNEVDDEKSE